MDNSRGRKRRRKDKPRLRGEQRLSEVETNSNYSNYESTNHLLGSNLYPDTRMVAYDVSKLPPNTTERQLLNAVKQIVPPIAIHIDIHIESREILTTGSIILNKQHSHIIEKRPIVLDNQILQIEKNPCIDEVLSVMKRKRTTVRHERELLWPDDIRPGNPRFIASGEIPPQEITPLDANIKGVHLLSDQVLIHILQYMSLIDLLNVELTCTRMRCLVRQCVLGNYTIINLAEPTCRWSHHKMGVSVHYHTLLIQKILLVNGHTLQHLHLHTLSFNVEYVVRAIRQCARLLTHFTYAKLDNLHYTSFYGGEQYSHRYVSIRGREDNPPFKIHCSDRAIPTCICTLYLSYVTPIWTSTAELHKIQAKIQDEALS